MSKEKLHEKSKKLSAKYGTALFVLHCLEEHIEGYKEPSGYLNLQFTDEMFDYLREDIDDYARKFKEENASD